MPHQHAALARHRGLQHAFAHPQLGVAAGVNGVDGHRVGAGGRGLGHTLQAAHVQPGVAAGGDSETRHRRQQVVVQQAGGLAQVDGDAGCGVGRAGGQLQAQAPADDVVVAAVHQTRQRHARHGLVLHHLALEELVVDAQEDGVQGGVDTPRLEGRTLGQTVDIAAVRAGGVDDVDADALTGPIRAGHGAGVFAYRRGGLGCAQVQDVGADQRLPRQVIGGVVLVAAAGGADGTAGVGDGGRADRVVDRAVEHDVADVEVLDRHQAGADVAVQVEGERAHRRRAGAVGQLQPHHGLAIAEHVDVVDDQGLGRGVGDAHLRQRIAELPQATAAADAAAGACPSVFQGAEDHVTGAGVADVVDDDVRGQHFVGGLRVAGGVTHAGVDGTDDLAAVVDDELDLKQGRAAREDAHVGAERDVLRPAVDRVAMRAAAGQRALADLGVAGDDDAAAVGGVHQEGQPRDHVVLQQVGVGAAARAGHHQGVGGAFNPVVQGGAVVGVGTHPAEQAGGAREGLGVGVDVAGAGDEVHTLQAGDHRVGGQLHQVVHRRGDVAVVLTLAVEAGAIGLAVGADMQARGQGRQRHGVAGDAGSVADDGLVQRRVGEVDVVAGAAVGTKALAVGVRVAVDVGPALGPHAHVPPHQHHGIAVDAGLVVGGDVGVAVGRGDAHGAAGACRRRGQRLQVVQRRHAQVAGSEQLRAAADVGVVVGHQGDVGIGVAHAHEAAAGIGGTAVGAGLQRGADAHAAVGQGIGGVGHHAAGIDQVGRDMGHHRGLVGDTRVVVADAHEAATGAARHR